MITYAVYNYVRDIGYKGKDEVMQRIAPYTFQLMKEDVLDLPGQLEENFYYELTGSQQAALNKVFNIIQPHVNQFNPYAIFRYLGYVHQIAHGRTSDIIDNVPLESNKPQLLRDILHIYRFDKLIIFCNYIDEVIEIKNNVQDYHIYILTGDTQNKSEVELSFRDDSTPSILVATFGVGGRGKNWQFCHDMLFYSPSWSYAKLAQARDRIHRIGQQEICRYFYFYANAFIDTCMVKAVSRKQDLETYLHEYLNEDNVSRLFGQEDHGSHQPCD